MLGTLNNNLRCFFWIADKNLLCSMIYGGTKFENRISDLRNFVIHTLDRYGNFYKLLAHDKSISGQFGSRDDLQQSSNVLKITKFP